jgi:hypothetical protein
MYSQRSKPVVPVDKVVSPVVDNPVREVSPVVPVDKLVSPVVDDPVREVIPVVPVVACVPVVPK